MKFSSSSIIAILATGILSAPVTGTSANSPGIVGQSADASTQLENRKEVSLTMYEDKEEAHGFCEDEVNDGNCCKLISCFLSENATVWLRHVRDI